ALAKGEPVIGAADLHDGVGGSGLLAEETEHGVVSETAAALFNQQQKSIRLTLSVDSHPPQEGDALISYPLVPSPTTTNAARNPNRNQNRRSTSGGSWPNAATGGARNRRIRLRNAGIACIVSSSGAHLGPPGGEARCAPGKRTGESVVEQEFSG